LNIFRPLHQTALVPYYVQPRYIPLAAPSTTFVYFADSGSGADGALADTLGPDAPTGADNALAADLGGDTGAGAEAAWWTAAVLFVDAASGSDGAVQYPWDGDYAFDPLGGPFFGGGGGGSGPTGALWTKTYEFLVVPLGGDNATPADGTLEGGLGGELAAGNDGGLSADLGDDFGTGGENETLSIFNAGIASTDFGTGGESSLFNWLGADVPAAIDSASAAALGADFGTPPDFALAGQLGGDSAAGGDSAFLENTTGTAVVSTDFGAGAEAQLLSPLGGDGATAADPGGGGFNSVVFVAALFVGDSSAGADSGFLRHLVSADIGLEGDLGTTDILTFGYHVYDNGGSGPIDYSTIVATILGFTTTTWTSSALSFPGDWKFGVRAFNANGEEKNLDAFVEIILDSSGNDITNRPIAPMGLRAFATAGAGVRVEWTYAAMNRAKLPTGFHVYIGTGGAPSYGSPVATVSYQAAIAGSWVANLAGLTGGTTYAVGVRAYNATAEEPNTTFVLVTADSSGPSSVVSLTATAVAG
jgi:hypothetical protein